jgi:Rad3-related DNA helicase
MTNLPSPTIMAPVHSRYGDWYPGQDRAFSDLMAWMGDPDSRFACVEAPTGSGKSLLAMMASIMSGRKTTILTATKGLQDQLSEDFGDQLVDIRGQNSYPCMIGGGELTVDHGVCHAGVECAHRQPDDGITPQCTYFERLRLAIGGDVVNTNYAYWLAQGNHGGGIGKRTLLICDEAHLAFQALESYKSVLITASEMVPLGANYPDATLPDWDMWKAWAIPAHDRVSDEVVKLKELVQEKGQGAEASLLKKLKSARNTEGKLKTLAESRGEWAWEKTNRGWSFIPVWPAEYMDELFFDVDKVVLMSAFLTPKVSELLGVMDPTWIRVPSAFPPENTPIKHIPTVRINRHSTPDHMAMWTARADQIVDRRMDRKGIFFTVSYQRRTTYYNNTRHRGIVHSHGTDNVVSVVNRFKRAAAPAVLVSPTVTSGWDFPGTDCEYIIVGKVPYPDTRSAVVKRRHALDSEWTSFMAMQTIVQEAGRGTRRPTDKCEVLIIDDTWEWWWPRYRKFAPKYFQERVLPSTPYVENPPW